MTIRFDTTDAQRMKFNTPFHIAIYNIYNLHFFFFFSVKFLINIYLLGKKSALVNLHSKLLISKLKVKRLGIVMVS